MNRPRVSAIWVLLGVFLVSMLVFGAKYHPIEEVNSAEWDGYVAKADAIRAGSIPRDAFHPLLYPVLAAGSGAILKDTFAGARLVSTIFAMLFVTSAYYIGRRCFSRPAGLFAAAATALNPNVIFMGVHAATDMMFAALATLTIAASLRAVDSKGARAAVPVAALFALAYFTRYTAVAMLPALVVPLVWGGSERSRSRVVTRILLFVAVCALVLIPHFVLTNRALGGPLVNESWKNLAFKLHADWDWEKLNDTPYRGALSVILDAPLAFIGAALRELAKFGYLTVLALGGYGLAGGLFAAGALLGAYTTLWNIDRRRLTLLIFVAGYVLVICAFFYTSPRLMLPILPVCYAWVGHALFGLNSGAPMVWGQFKFSRALPIAGLFLLLTLASTAREMPQFVAMHPVEEVAALVRIEQEYGTSITVFGTAPYFGRHVHYDYRYLRVPSGAAASEPSAYIDRLRSQVTAFQYVVLGRLTARGAPPGLIDGTDVPDFLTLIELSPAVAVYRVSRPAGSEF